MNKRQIINITSQIFVLIGAIGFLAGFLISMDIIRYDKELPISEISSITVSSDEQIYVSLQFYGKVQCYDNNGNFINNWRVRNGGGSFKIWITDDIVHVATARGDNYSLYDLHGNEISTIQQDLYSKRDENKHISFKDVDYYVSPGLFPNIIKETDNSKIKLIKRNFLMYVLQGPFPAWLILAFGTIISMFINRDKLFKGKQKDSEPEQSKTQETYNLNQKDFYTKSIKYPIRQDFKLIKLSDIELLEILKADLIRWEKGKLNLSNEILCYQNIDYKKRNQFTFNINQLLSADMTQVDYGEFSIITTGDKKFIRYIFTDKNSMSETVKGVFRGLILMIAVLLFSFIKFNTPLIPSIYVLVIMFGLIFILSYTLPLIRFRSMIKRIIMKAELKINEL